MGIRVIDRRKYHDTSKDNKITNYLVKQEKRKTTQSSYECPRCRHKTLGKIGQKKIRGRLRNLYFCSKCGYGTFSDPKDVKKPPEIKYYDTRGEAESLRGSGEKVYFKSGHGYFIRKPKFFDLKQDS